MHIKISTRQFVAAVRLIPRTLQVLASGEALMRGKHGPFLRGNPPSHADQARLEV